MSSTVPFLVSPQATPFVDSLLRRVLLAPGFGAWEIPLAEIVRRDTVLDALLPLLDASSFPRL